MNFLDKRVVLVVGKGGVGRSTVAASIALQNARAGKRTLLYQTNATDRFGMFFGKPALGIRSAELAPNLWGVNTNPTAALEEYGLVELTVATDHADHLLSSLEDRGWTTHR